MSETKIVKGYIRYYIEMDNRGELQIATELTDYDLSDDLVKGFYAERCIYSLMDGEEFLECVKSGEFIDYDGTLSEIFIDDYRTNLGLIEEGIAQGEFMVNGNFFKELCKNYKVEVNWANK